MSRIGDLLKEVAPEGVEQVELGSIATLVRGNGMPRSVLTDEGVGAIHYGQIYTRYGAWTKATISFVAPETAAKLATADPGDVIITNTSENVDDVCKAVAWLGSEPIVTGGHATVIKHNLEPKYLSYWFQSPAFAKQKRALATGTKVIDVSAKQLLKVRVPVPPLAVQREMVRVLDQFTQLEAELEVELQAELEARRRQYNHYRQEMLDQVRAPRVSLASLGTWVGGMTPSKHNPAFWEDGDIPWLASMDVSNESTDEIRGRVTARAVQETSLKVVRGPSIPVVMRSNILRRTLPIGFVEADTTVNQDIRALVVGEGVDARFAYQVLRADSGRIRERCVRTDGSMAAVDSKSFFAWEVPLPDVSEQRRVASALDQLDSLVRNLSIGLSAELAARRKQYAYYRDRLLTFEEVTV